MSQVRYALHFLHTFHSAPDRDDANRNEPFWIYRVELLRKHIVVRSDTQATQLDIFKKGKGIAREPGEHVREERRRVNLRFVIVSQSILRFPHARRNIVIGQIATPAASNTWRGWYLSVLNRRPLGDPHVSAIDVFNMGRNLFKAHRHSFDVRFWGLKNMIFTVNVFIVWYGLTAHSFGPSEGTSARRCLSLLASQAAVGKT